MPKNITARPTTDFARENLFNVLENLVDFEGKDALDLFAGTGAISFELLSRGCRSVTSVEMAGTQYAFIKKVSQQLGCDNHRVLRTDALKYISVSGAGFDIIFADPPYDMKDFDKVPEAVLASGLLVPGGIFIIEHSGRHDFSHLPGFLDHRTYGSVNFTIFSSGAQ